MNLHKPLDGRVLVGAAGLLLGLGGCADLSNMVVQLGSSRPPAILQVQSQRLDGKLTLSPDRTGTLEATANHGEPSSCLGALRFTSSTQGEVDLRCNDGTAAALKFSMLTAIKGYAYGASHKGPVALAFGMMDDEARAYLQSSPRGGDTVSASVEQVDCVVVGAGVVGLAVARALAQAGREVLVLEACDAFGTQTSARNSEVIHAGIYYPAGSLKAQLCVRGKQLLYDYCAERGLPHQRCGKFIVATDAAQVAKLQGIHAKAVANGVHDLVLLDAAQARAAEPQLQCLAALHSPSTGIVDSHALMLSLLGDLERAGGVLALNSTLASANAARKAIDLIAGDGTLLRARTVVNAAGLQAPALAARFAGLAPQHVPQAHFAKGNYFTLAGRSPFSRLIYPVPEAAGLGVHLTIDLGGQARFGPDVQWVDDPQDLAVDPARGNAFYAEVRKYWPALPDHALLPAYAGMRPKIVGPGQAAADFVIQGPAVHGVPGLVNLFGIESPGLTSALAIAEHVQTLLASQ